MTRKQLFALFTCSLIVWTVGGSLFTLLPGHARQLGADDSLAGFYLASAFFATTIGSISAGWLAKRFQRRRLMLLLAGGITIPTLLLMSRATTLPALIITTDLAWFLAGVELTLLAILTGLFADKSTRGRTFGVIATTNGIANVIGGLAAGRIADDWGMSTLIALLAGVQIGFPLVAWLLEDRVVEQPSPGRVSSAGHGESLGLAFYLLLLANITVWVSFHVNSLGRPLTMDTIGFDRASISSVVAVRGAFSLPLPILIGWLSDRLGRKQLIALTYVGSMISLLVLTGASELWHFWLSALFISAVRSGSVVGSALVTDLVAPEALDTAMSRFDATGWIGAIIGLSGTGVVIQSIGAQPTFLLGAFLPLLALGLLYTVRPPRSALSLVRS